MDALQFENNTCKSVAYEDLSNEFQSLYPTVVRAFQLIHVMHRCPTLASKFGFNRSNDRQLSRVNAVCLERRGEFAGNDIRLTKEALLE